MKEIKLFNSDKVAIVDDEDFEELSKYQWSFLKSGKSNGYASRRGPYKLVTYNGKDFIKKTTTINMHRQLMNFPENMLVDHKNINGLDNRRENLRLATLSDNMKNKKPMGKSSKYKGVCFLKKINKWNASISINGKPTVLGPFETELEAANAYDKAAIETGNPFYYINFPEKYP